MLSEHLKAFGAVCVEGPKWCGKTWLAQHQAVSACMIADPTDNFATRGRVELDINYAFSGGKPHLIDEWQEFPALWDATRYHVDQNAEPGQFILTGSSVPKTKGVMHSGTGRIASMRLRTMSLWESGNSEGLVSLADLCERRRSCARRQRSWRMICGRSAFFSRSLPQRDSRKSPRRCQPADAHHPL